MQRCWPLDVLAQRSDHHVDNQDSHRHERCKYDIYDEVNDVKANEHVVCSCPSLSLVISAQFALKMYLAAGSSRKIHKTFWRSRSPKIIDFGANTTSY